MSKIPDQNDPPQVLSYVTADVGSVQPVDSRFVCEYHEDGVTLTEPSLTSGTAMQFILGIAVLILGAALLIAGIHRNLAEPDFDVISIVIPCMIAGVGFVLVFKSRSERERPFVIEVQNGRLMISRRSIVRWRRSWRTASLVKIKVSNGVPSLSGGRLYSDVLALSRWGLAVPVLESRPKDECLWVARVLREAMKLPPASED